MAKKENQRITLTKRLLQEGLLRLLETKALEKISVTELCREAGINRATFYNHYDSPQGLLADLEAQMAQDLQALISPPKTVDETIDQMETVCTYLKEHVKTVSILIRCHADSELAEIFSNLDRRYAQTHLNSKLALDPDSARLVSTFLYSGTYHLILEWLLQDIPKTPREIATLAMSIVSKDYL